MAEIKELNEIEREYKFYFFCSVFFLIFMITFFVIFIIEMGKVQIERNVLTAFGILFSLNTIIFVWIYLSYWQTKYYQTQMFNKLIEEIRSINNG